MAPLFLPPPKRGSCIPDLPIARYPVLFPKPCKAYAIKSGARVVKPPGENAIAPEGRKNTRARRSKSEKPRRGESL